MKHTFRTLLGLAFIVFVFSGCPNPSGPEIPEGAKVEFVWGTNHQIVNQPFKNELFMKKISRYLLGLESDQNAENYYYSYPKGYDEDKYDELCDNEECLKKFYEDAFEKVFGTKYYKEGKVIDLKKWILPAKDLTTGDTCPGYSQLYFLAEDIGKADYESYLDYLNKNSFDKIEVYNQDIKIYVYWKYTRNNN